MPIAQPQSSDLTSIVGPHSLLHRIIAADTGAPVESLIVDSNGRVGANQTTPLGQAHISLGTITAQLPALLLDGTWNASGITFGAIQLKITDTASAVTSLFLDLQKGGISQFNVDKSGNVAFLGNVNTGTWQATAIAATYGGTGINTSASTGIPSISAGTWSVNATVGVSLGGTGAATLTSNGVLFGNGTGTIQATSAGAQNSVLIANGGAPSFSQNPIINTSLQVGVVSATTGSFKLANSASANLLTVNAGNNASAWTLTFPTGPGSNGQVLTTNGSGATSWTTPASGDFAAITMVSDYTTPSNYLLATTNTGATSFANSYGGHVTTGGNADSYAVIVDSFTAAVGNTVNAFSRSSNFSCRISLNNAGTTMSSFIGIGDHTGFSAGSIDYTKQEYGFKILGASSVYSLYGTNGDGTTEAATSALTTLSSGDWLDLFASYDGSSTIRYYWSKNGGAWSSATSATTHLPTSSTNTVGMTVGSQSTVAAAAKILVKYFYFNS